MRRYGVAVAVAAVAAFTGSAHAGFQAYFGPANNGTTGNTNYTGSMGLDFDVGGAAIRVTRLGAFDSFLDQNGGFGTNTISVAIFDRNNPTTAVGPVVTFTGTEGTLTNNFRLKDIAPLTLAAGFQGSIVAWSYNSTERAYDSNVAAFPAGWGTDGGGLISFVGSGRTGTSGLFPNDPITPGSVNRFGAGTFVFESVQAVPAPPAVVLLGMAAGGGLLLRVRRKKTAA